MKIYPDSPLAHYAKTGFERYVLWRIEAATKAKWASWALCIAYTVSALCFPLSNEVRVAAWALIILMWLLLAETYVYSAVLRILERQHEIIINGK